MIEAPIDTGIPKPITRPKLKAKLVAANSFLPIFFSKYSGKIGLNPSLNTAIPLFARIEQRAPNRAITTNSKVLSILIPSFSFKFYLIHP